MPVKIIQPKLPQGISRLAFRLPIWLYKALWWLLGSSTGYFGVFYAIFAKL